MTTTIAPAATGLVPGQFRYGTNGKAFLGVEVVSGEGSGLVVGFSYKDMTDQRRYNGTTRVFGACDELVADLNELEPRFVAYTDKDSSAAEILAEKLWLTWRDQTKKVAQNRLAALLTRIAEAEVDTLDFQGADFAKIRFSFKAGCSCPCSPGFILNERVQVGWRGVDIYIHSAEKLQRLS